MKIKKALLATLPVVAIVLELLPYGAVLNFANPDGEPWRQTYSYFSLTPFGYANFGPFFTALLTCVLLILAVAALFKYSEGLGIAILNISGIAVLTSLLPLMFGVRYITVIGVVISLLLLAEFFVALYKSNR